jgi:hypothetical protein
VIGSTAERVIHGAPRSPSCRTASKGGEPHTVGVAHTQSPEGEQALRSGVTLAHAAEAALRVIIVLHEAIGTLGANRPGARAAQQLPEEIAAQQRGVFDVR